MAYQDEKARKEIRYRVNLNHYQSEAIEALARLHRKQTASYLAEIIRQHLEAYSNASAQPAREGQDNRTGRDRRLMRVV